MSWEDVKAVLVVTFCALTMLYIIKLFPFKRDDLDD